MAIRDICGKAVPEMRGKIPPHNRAVRAEQYCQRRRLHKGEHRSSTRRWIDANSHSLPRSKGTK